MAASKPGKMKRKLIWFDFLLTLISAHLNGKAAITEKQTTQSKSDASTNLTRSIFFSLGLHCLLMSLMTIN